MQRQVQEFTRVNCPNANGNEKTQASTQRMKKKTKKHVLELTFAFAFASQSEPETQIQLSTRRKTQVPSILCYHKMASTSFAISEEKLVESEETEAINSSIFTPNG